MDRPSTLGCGVDQEASRSPYAAWWDRGTRLSLVSETLTKATQKTNTYTGEKAVLPHEETAMPVLETRDGLNLPVFSGAKHLRHDVFARDGMTGARLNAIDRFDQEYHFLSNFYRVPIPAKVAHLTFGSVEQAFQWGKAFHAQDHTAMGRLAHTALSPAEAKQLGALVANLPDTWAQYKVRLMLQLLKVKFQHPGLAGLLRKTRGFRLVEGNYWHDNFWGVCSCKACPGHGHNILGRQLEKVRESL